MSGKVVHFEIPFDDQERARTFYSEAFGWAAYFKDVEGNLMGLWQSRSPESQC